MKDYAFINEFIEALMVAFDPENENGRHPSEAEQELELSYLDTTELERDILEIGRKRYIRPAIIEELLDLIEAAGLSTFRVAENTEEYFCTKNRMRYAALERTLYLS